MVGVQWPLVLVLYRTPDVNMNGQVKYTSSADDRDPILVDVGTPRRTM